MPTDLSPAIIAASEFIKDTKDVVRIDPRNNVIVVDGHTIESGDMAMLASAYNTETGEFDLSKINGTRLTKSINALRSENNEASLGEIAIATISLSNEIDNNTQKAFDFILQAANAKAGLDAAVNLMSDDKMLNNNMVIVSDPFDPNCVIRITGASPPEITMDELKTMGRLWFEKGDDGELRFDPASTVNLDPTVKDRISKIVEVLNGPEFSGETRYNVYRMATAAKYYENYIGGTDDFAHEPQHHQEVMGILSSHPEADVLDYTVRNNVPNNSISRDIVGEADEIVNPEQYTTPTHFQSGRPANHR